MSENPTGFTRTTTPQPPHAWPVNTPRTEPTNEELGLAPASAVAPPNRRPRRHRGRRVWRGAGIAALAVLAVGGIGYVASPAHSSHASWTADGVTAVDMDLSAGDVQITESTDSQVHFSEDLAWHGGEYKTDHSQSGSTLTIRTEHSAIRWGFNVRDHLRYTVAIPKGAAITYHQSAGDTNLNGSFGAVDITTSAGDVKSGSLGASSLAIQTTAGDVTLSQVTSPRARITQTAGDSKLRFATAPDQLDVKTTAGNVDIALPAGTSYAVTEHRTAGDQSVTVPRDATSTHHVGVETNAGDVKIHT